MSEQSLRLSQKGGIQSYAKNVNIPSEQLVLEDKRKYIWKGTEGCTLESLMRSRASKGNKVTTVSSCFLFVACSYIKTKCEHIVGEEEALSVLIRIRRNKRY